MGLIRKLDFDLGGSREVTMYLASGWQNADDYPIDVGLNGTSMSGVDVLLRIECRAGVGETITPRLYNVTDDVAVQTCDPCTANDADYSGLNQVQEFPITLAAGLKRYRLQGGQNPGVEGSYLIGSLVIGDAS